MFFFQFSADLQTLANANTSATAVIHDESAERPVGMGSNQSPQTEAIAGEYIVFAEFFAIEE